MIVDITGKNFGRLTAIETAGTRNRKMAWRCECSCGNETIVTGVHLRRGEIQSCGCLQRERAAESTGRRNRKHGHAARSGFTSEYRSFWSMHRRCLYPSHTAYKWYGARGIIVCERWQTFENFLADMGPKPTPKHQIDRLDSNGNYEPGNCRWATAQQQQEHKRAWGTAS